MKVRYTRRAFKQLSAVLDYIDMRSPQGAENVKRRIQAAIDILAEHPHAGRVTSRVGFRRIVAYPYPTRLFTGQPKPRSSFTASCMGHAAHAANPRNEELEAVYGQA